VTDSPDVTEDGDTDTEVVVAANDEVLAVPNTVPVRSASVGIDVELSVAVRHGGVPDGPESELIVCQELPVHHSRVVAPFRLQSVMTRLVKVLPEERLTSKYWPVPVDNAPTGSPEYWATVTVPSPPEASAVTPSLVTLPVEPPGVLELPL
jgi:hypothetical protein